MLHTCTNKIFLILKLFNKNFSKYRHASVKVPFLVCVFLRSVESRIPNNHSKNNILRPFVATASYLVYLFVNRMPGLHISYKKNNLNMEQIEMETIIGSSPMNGSWKGTTLKIPLKGLLHISVCLFVLNLLIYN